MDRDEPKTIVRPSPGGSRRRGGGAEARPQPIESGSRGERTARAAPPPPRRAAPRDYPSRRASNPLLREASRILALVPQLRQSLTHPDPMGLARDLEAEVRDFQARTRRMGIEDREVMSASVALCAAIDEAVLGTPWGRSSGWGEQPLSSVIHGNTKTGVLFFDMLEQGELQDPRYHIDLIELKYVILSLGFRGKYWGDEHQPKLERRRAELYEIIRSERGDPPVELSPHWEGVKDHRTKLARFVPLWVIAAAGAGLLVLVYGFFAVRIGQESEAVLNTLTQLGRDVANVDRNRPLAPPVRIDVRPFLAQEIDAGLLEVLDVARGQVVRIRGDGLFASGSDEVVRDRVPLIERIGDALDQVEGRVLVIGHSDNVPIRTLRFKSNYELSEARAQSVMDILAARVSRPGRLAREGVADTQPLVPNDTPANRALNRRVEISLIAPRADI